MALPGFSGDILRENNAPEVCYGHAPEHVPDNTVDDGAQDVAKIETASQVIESPVVESKPSLICGTEEQSRTRRARQLIMSAGVGMKRKIVYIVLAVVLLLIVAIIGGTVGGILGSRADSGSPTAEIAIATTSLNPSSTASSAETTIPTSSTYSSTTDQSNSITAEETTTPSPTASKATSTSSAPCSEGTVAAGESQNYLGLCKFSCAYGYCPPGPCTCTSHGDGKPLPPETGAEGCPLPGSSEGYRGLCSFACNHGYCPPGACSTECQVD